MDQFVRSVTILGIVDGDTIDVNADLGFDVNQKLRVRLFGIDTPERGHAGYKEATARLAELLPVGSSAVMRTVKDKKEKYGRYLAVIMTDACPEGVSLTMITEGFGKPYYGGTKEA